MKQLLSILCMVFCALDETAAQDDRFSWLIGTWKLEGRNAFEVWDRGGPAQWSGKSFRVKGADTVVTEIISLRFFDGSFHYIPDVAGDQPPVDFRITSSDGQRFTAENPSHDFPQAIRYRHIIKNGKNFIEAYIEGGGKVISYSFEKL